MGLRRLRRSNRRSKLAGRWPHFLRVPPLVPPPALLRANGRATARWLDNVNSFFDYRNNQHQPHHGSRHRRHAGPPPGRRGANSLGGRAGQTLPGPGQEVDPKRPPGTSGPGFCGRHHPQRGHERGDDRGAGGGTPPTGRCDRRQAATRRGTTNPLSLLLVVEPSYRTVRRQFVHARISRDHSAGKCVVLDETAAAVVRGELGVNDCPMGSVAKRDDPKGRCTTNASAGDSGGYDPFTPRASSIVYIACVMCVVNMLVTAVG